MCVLRSHNQSVSLFACMLLLLLHAGYAFCLEGGGKDRIAAEEEGGSVSSYQGKGKEEQQSASSAIPCLLGWASELLFPPLLFPRKKSRAPPPPAASPPPPLFCSVEWDPRWTTDGRKCQNPTPGKKGRVWRGGARRGERSGFICHLPLFLPSPLPVWRFLQRTNLSV